MFIFGKKKYEKHNTLKILNPGYTFSNTEKKNQNQLFFTLDVFQQSSTNADMTPQG